MNEIMKNGILFTAGLIAFFLIFAAATNFSTVFAIPATQNAGTGASSVSQSGNGELQVVKVEVKGSQYVFSPSELKQGVPVRLEFEMSTLRGCSRSIVIPEFKIKKRLSESDNKVEFTPTKAGTFNIACSMNMYVGTFTVLQNDGTKSDYVQPAPAPNTGGSCGCGGAGGACGI